MKTFNATQLSKVMQAGLNNARKGALQTVLSNAALTLTKGEKLTPEEIKDNLTGSKLSESALKKAVTRAGKISALVESAIPYLNQDVAKAITNLYNCETEAKFNTEVEKVIKTIAFMAGEFITSASDVEKLFNFYTVDGNGYDKEGYNFHGYDLDGFNKQGFNADGFNVKGVNADGKTVDDVAQEQAAIEQEKQAKADAKEAQKLKNETLAAKALAALRGDMPTLSDALDNALQSQSVEGAIITLATEVKAQMAKLEAEKLALENKLAAKTPLKKVS